MNGHTTGQPDEKPRLPGVRYRSVTRVRMETTVIDGRPSTREVQYEAWEPVPPRDWDDLVLRGITALTVTVTVIAAVATTASIGGLLSSMVLSGIAYAMGAVFTSAWLVCLGWEWLNRLTPERARSAKIAGWVALLISMSAVFAYGHTLHQSYAGGFGAAIDLLTKGLWAQLIAFHSVSLTAGVAHWVTDEEQRLAARELLSGRIARLNRRKAYQQAVGSQEFKAADAILTSVETTQVLTAPDAPVTVSEQASAMPAPVPPVPAQVPVPPAPPVEPGPVHQPASSPAPPVVPAQTSVPQAPPVQTPASESPHLQAVGGPFKSDTIRAVIAAEPGISDDELIAQVNAAHGADPKNAESVPRLRRRIENKAKKKAAS